MVRKMTSLVLKFAFFSNKFFFHTSFSEALKMCCVEDKLCHVCTILDSFLLKHNFLILVYLGCICERACVCYTCAPVCSNVYGVACMLCECVFRGGCRLSFSIRLLISLRWIAPLNRASLASRKPLWSSCLCSGQCQCYWCTVTPGLLMRILGIRTHIFILLPNAALLSHLSRFLKGNFW